MTELRRVPTHPELWCSREGVVFHQKNDAMKPLNQNKLKNGYMSVSPQLVEGRKMLYVHRLVCLGFHGQPPTPKCLVLHTDGDSRNNHPGNLRWGNHADNQSDKKKHGRSRCGERSPLAKLTELKAFAVREAAALGVPLQGIADRYGVSVRTVTDVVRGKSWSKGPPADSPARAEDATGPLPAGTP